LWCCTLGIDTPFSRLLAAILDDGETQTLTLARQLDCGVLMDERRGRRVAHHYHIPVIGTLGVLLQAKKQGQLFAIKPLIEQLQASGYRFSQELLEYAVAAAGE
jgi:predicted nucleic acid-binding protein